MPISPAVVIAGGHVLRRRRSAGPIGCRPGGRPRSAPPVRRPRRRQSPAARMRLSLSVSATALTRMPAAQMPMTARPSWNKALMCAMVCGERHVRCAVVRDCRPVHFGILATRTAIRRAKASPSLGQGNQGGAWQRWHAFMRRPPLACVPISSRNKAPLRLRHQPTA